MADERDAFLREIDEEVRRERLLKLWDAYGVYVIGVVAAVVLVVAGWKWYEASVRSAAERAGAQFVEVTQLLSDGKTEAALQGLEQIAREGASGYAQLAQLRLAAHARQEDKPADAIVHYEAVANDSSADQVLRSFAQLQIAATKLDNAPWTETANRLTDLLKPESVWKYAARELLGLAAYNAGEYEKARQAFTELLASADTPPAYRQRAQVLMTLIARNDGAQSVEAKPDKVPETSSEAKQTGDATIQ
ncbi:MAG: tetratricopeptide repeat protein [Hyphomicrobiaceae bacterium]